MFRSALVVIALTASGAVGLGSAGAAQAAPDRVVGHVFEATNDVNGNAVAVFDRHSDGSLQAAGQVATGGLGLGKSLASQGGLVRDGRLLFVVNAGDDTVSSLRTAGDSVELRDTISSGGDRPVSVTVHHGIGYVLDQGSDVISGFRYDRSGDLRRLPFSTRALTPNPAGGPTDAAQIQFSGNGRTLVVTEKAANNIDTFRVRFGYAGWAHPHASAGTVPYGFDFDRRGTLVVSEAATGSASSYRVSPWFHNITAAVPDTQAAACWLVVSGHYAWVVNAASDSISSYWVHRNGALELVQAVAASTGPGPTDAAVSPRGDSLHVRLRDGSVASYAIGHDGSLTSVGTAFQSVAFGPAGLIAD